MRVRIRIRSFARLTLEQAEVGVRLVRAQDREHARQFTLNVVKNTKYTLWNFIPKNLMEQFS